MHDFDFAIAVFQNEKTPRRGTGSSGFARTLAGDKAVGSALFAKGLRGMSASVAAPVFPRGCSFSRAVSWSSMTPMEALMPSVGNDGRPKTGRET